MLRLMAMIMGGLLLMGEVTTGEAATQPAWLDYWREATVALGTVKKAKVTREGKESMVDVFVVVGTGVIFGAGEGKPPLLVTAKHIFFDPAKNWNPSTIRLRFAWFEDRPVEDYLGIEIALRKSGKQLWISHPTADLAALPLIISTADAGRDKVAPVPIGNFASAADIFEGAPVVVLGYPGAVGPTFWTRALARGGTIAWVNPKNPATEPLLVDSLLFPGNSGGPVLKVPTAMGRTGGFVVGDKVLFLGIVSQGRTLEMPLTAGGKTIEIQGPRGPEIVFAGQFIGVGIIEPAARVLELIERATQ